MKTVYLLILGLAYATGVPTKVIGGTLATIDQYPTIVSLLRDSTGSGTSFTHACAGTIINTRHILTTAHCFDWFTQPERWLARVGSAFANSGGTVYNVTTIIKHPRYGQGNYHDSDIAITRTTSAITYVANAVQPAFFAGANYEPGDGAAVWTVGWGFTSITGQIRPAQMHHVQIWTINQRTCGQRLNSARVFITENMICSGWLDVGLRDHCRDSGSPIYHNGVVIGIHSFGSCGSPFHPSVNTRISRFVDWIQQNV